MKITVTTTIDTESSDFDEAKKKNNINVENLKNWSDLHTLENCQGFIEKYEGESATANLAPKGWNLDNDNRNLLIDLLSSAEALHTSRLAFGIQEVPNEGATSGYNKLVILIQPNTNEEKYYVVSEKRGGPTGTLPTITPHPPRAEDTPPS